MFVKLLIMNDACFIINDYLINMISLSVFGINNFYF